MDRPDGIYKWIGHYMDHWSKFHVIFPLSRKSCAKVALVFIYLGTLHSDEMKLLLKNGLVK